MWGGGGWGYRPVSLIIMREMFWGKVCDTPDGPTHFHPFKEGHHVAPHHLAPVSVTVSLTEDRLDLKFSTYDSISG